MPENSVNYYGYDKETYLECSELIHMTNRKHIFIMTSWFLIVNVLYLIFSTLNLFGVSRSRVPFYAVYVAFGFILDISLIFFPKFSRPHSVIYVYLTILMLLSYGIVSSVIQPYMPATMYLVLSVITALSFIDKMYRMIITFFLFVFMFTATSFIFKTFSIAYYDLYNSMIVMTLVIGLHYSFQRTRIQQFVLYQKDLQVQHELEIKSSFDSLTTLFNRGKFFSIAEEVLRKKHDEYMAFCLLDLDGFKQVNDSLGHQMGDKVIQVTGKIILETLEFAECERWLLAEKIIRDRLSFAGRLGGDEFIIFLRGKSSRTEVRCHLEKLLKALNEVRFSELEGIHASFGVTELSTIDTDIDNAYRRADDALYRAKRVGKNRIFFNDESDSQQGES